MIKFQVSRVKTIYSNQSIIHKR